jgi:hypothetical protein
VVDLWQDHIKPTVAHGKQLVVAAPGLRIRDCGILWAKATVWSSAFEVSGPLFVEWCLKSRPQIFDGQQKVGDGEKAHPTAQRG